MPRGCLPRGCLPTRVSAQGCLPGGVCLGGVYLGGVCPRGCLPGGVCQGDVSAWWVSAKGGVCLGKGVYIPACNAVDTPSPVYRMTEKCKNITLPQTSFAGGKNDHIR